MKDAPKNANDNLSLKLEREDDEEFEDVEETDINIENF